MSVEMEQKAEKDLKRMASLDNCNDKQEFNSWYLDLRYCLLETTVNCILHYN